MACPALVDACAWLVVYFGGDLNTRTHSLSHLVSPCFSMQATTTMAATGDTTTQPRPLRRPAAPRYLLIFGRRSAACLSDPYESRLLNLPLLIGRHFILAAHRSPLLCLSSLSVCLSLCLPVCLSVCLPVCLPVCLSVCLSQPLCVSFVSIFCLCACVPVCVSLPSL